MDTEAHYMTMTPTLLAHAFMARDVLREALGITAVTIHSSLGSILVETPLKKSDLYLSLTISLDNDWHEDDAPTCRACIFKTFGPDLPPRRFKFNRNNLLGYLGLTTIPALNEPINVSSLEASTWITRRMQLQLDFGWDRRHGSKASPDIYLTKPLEPKSEHTGDKLQIRKPPYPYYKVFSSPERGDTPWAYARVHPNGQGQDPQGPLYISAHEAQDAAEFMAITQGHLPLDPNRFQATRVVMWTSLYIERNDASIHLQTARLSNGQTVCIEHGFDCEEEPLWAYSVSLREHNGGQHAGTLYFDHAHQALHAALNLISMTQPAP